MALAAFMTAPTICTAFTALRYEHCKPSPKVQIRSQNIIFGSAMKFFRSASALLPCTGLSSLRYKGFSAMNVFGAFPKMSITGRQYLENLKWRLTIQRKRSNHCSRVLYAAVIRHLIKTCPASVVLATASNRRHSVVL